MTTNNLHQLHWNDDDLLDRLYGLDAPAGKDAAHLESCEECGGRWRALAARRSELGAAPAAICDSALRAQREKIWARVEDSRRSRIWRAVPAMATAMMLMVGVALNYGPGPESQMQQAVPVQQAKAEVSDDQLFSEIASIANSEEPSSAAALRNLFDTTAEGEAQ